jgi:hypothetical protein
MLKKYVGALTLTELQEITNNVISQVQGTKSKLKYRFLISKIVSLFPYIDKSVILQVHSF